MEQVINTNRGLEVEPVGRFFISTVDVLTMAKKKGKVIAVVGSRNCDMATFAENLVKNCYPRVAVLHNGVEIFRNSAILCVPNA